MARVTKKRISAHGLTPALDDWLNSRPYKGGFAYMCAYHNCGLPQYRGTRELWDRHKEPILKQWIKDNPCTRPARWWDFDAPKELVPWCEGWEYYAHQPYRHQVGGSATPAHYANTVNGIPNCWMEDIDTEDPPTHESQAAYLDRHGLLTAAEKKHLAKHPELLEPEALKFEEDDIEYDEPAA